MFLQSGCFQPEGIPMDTSDQTTKPQESGSQATISSLGAGPAAGGEHRKKRMENRMEKTWKTYGNMILEANKQSSPQCVPLHRATLLFPIFRPVIISLWGVQFGTFWNHATARVLFQSHLQILSFCMFLDPPHILKPPAPAEASLPSVQKRQRPGPSSCADDGVEPEGVPLETRGAVVETSPRAVTFRPWKNLKTAHPAAAKPKESPSPVETPGQASGDRNAESYCAMLRLLQWKLHQEFLHHRDSISVPVIPIYVIYIGELTTIWLPVKVMFAPLNVENILWRKTWIF